MIRRKDKENKLILTDIAKPDFDPSPFSLTTMMSEIHGRLPSGEYVTGVEVFRQIYSRIGFVRLVGISKWPVIRHGLDLFYSVFARIRFWTAKNRLKKASNCNDQSCNLSDSQPQVQTSDQESVA